ncbi:META domain-containing protein [Actinotalea sp. AC32]|nr:META domain-containing protein [Actinotalea sp. AC32]
MTDRTREVLASPATLPAGLVAPERDALVGRWVADAPVADDEPHVDLTADGTYTGSDGCNGAGGRWGLGADGRFLATSGPMTAIGCDGAPVPTWVATARRAGMDGESLVLLDADGGELGRLSRSG